MATWTLGWAWGTPWWTKASLRAIIRFVVDPNAMTITMLPQSHADLIDTVWAFATLGQWWSLHNFQRLAGWMNWALNTHLLLHPGISFLYAKVSGKSQPQQLIWISVMLCQELTWFANWVENSDGVHIPHSHEWEPADADLTIFSDACPTGMVFWIPTLDLTFQHAISGQPEQIFHFEALTVVSALWWLINHFPVHSRFHLVIHTDNLNTVDMFNTLQAQPSYNPLLHLSTSSSHLIFNFKLCTSLDLRTLSLMCSRTSVTILSLPLLLTLWTPLTDAGGGQVVTSCPHSSRQPVKKP